MKRHFKINQALLCFFLFFFLIGDLFAQNPGKAWEKFKTPEQAGWSSEKLKEIYNDHNISALLIIYNGKAAAAFGNIQRRYKCHSVRKSFLSALYGIHVDNGDINLNKTLNELNIEEITPLTETEKEAQIKDLLKARSGIFLPAGAETEDQRRNRPTRESHKHNTFWFYNNWDFNVLGTIFEKETKTDIFVDFYNRIAKPLQMEDFRVMDGTHDYFERETSIHPSYPFKMSGRDMARFGQLYLQKGKWNGKQILSEKWIEESATPYSTVSNWGPEYEGYGYLWWTKENFNGSKMYLASGVGGQYIGVFPAENVVIVMRGDTYTGQFIRERYDAVKKIFEAKILKPKKNPEFIPLLSLPKIETIKLTPQQRKKYIGEYKGEYINVYNSRYHKGKDHTFFIMEKNGELILERYDYFYHFRLLPISETKFFVEDLELLLIFELDEKGVPKHPVFFKTEETAKLYYTIVNKGISAGVNQFEAVMKNIKDAFDLKFLAYDLRLMDKQIEAVEVLKLNVLRFPWSVANHREFREHFLKHNDIKALSDIYVKMLNRLKKGKKGYEIVQWFSQWIKARAFPIKLSNEELSRYIGKYGPRRIIIKNGDLYYYRDDREIIREYRLLKVYENTFILDDDYPDVFRLRFVMGKNNQAAKVIGLDIDGSTNESIRDN
jgi:CubicO group peptidase (beta-lactamase class C family)